MVEIGPTLGTAGYDGNYTSFLTQTNVCFLLYSFGLSPHIFSEFSSYLNLF